MSPPGGGAGTNPQGAVALTGGDVAPGAGRIAAPTSRALRRGVAGGTEVTYTFDKLITQGRLGPGRSFGYYTRPARRSAPRASSRSRPGVKVMFATTVAATARVFVTNDAVTLAGQPDHGNAATATSGAGGIPPATSAPDLVGITRVASLQATYDLTYRPDITSNTRLAGGLPGRHVVGPLRRDRRAVQGANTVRVTFGGLAASSRADEEIVRITDTGGCATATRWRWPARRRGAVQNKDHTPGFTSGPI